MFKVCVSVCVCVTTVKMLTSTDIEGLCVFVSCANCNCCWNSLRVMLTIVDIKGLCVSISYAYIKGLLVPYASSNWRGRSVCVHYLLMVTDVEGPCVCVIYADSNWCRVSVCMCYVPTVTRLRVCVGEANVTLRASLSSTFLQTATFGYATEVALFISA